MSNEAQAIALRHSRASSAIVKMVLIGIANHDGDGGAWPSVATLAEYAVCSPRSVQRAIDELERLGEVRRIVQGGGRREMPDYGRPNLYEFLLRCPPDCDGTKNHRTRRSRAFPVELEGLSTPLRPVDKPGDTQSPGDTASPGPVTHSHPNQSSEATTDRGRDDPQTARPRVTRTGWSTACIDGTMTGHQVSRTTGRCAFCAATRTRWEEEA